LVTKDRPRRDMRLDGGKIWASKEGKKRSRRRKTLPGVKKDKMRRGLGQPIE